MLKFMIFKLDRFISGSYNFFNNQYNNFQKDMIKYRINWYPKKICWNFLFQMIQCRAEVVPVKALFKITPRETDHNYLIFKYFSMGFFLNILQILLHNISKFL